MTDKNFLSWTQGLAKELGGVAKAVSAETICLELPPAAATGATPILLSVNPQNPAEWKTRLQYVEKRVARALISAPVCFSCSVSQAGKKPRGVRELGTVVRFAFGLSLSLGVECVSRFTAYWVSGTNQAFYLKAQDGLYEACSDLAPANLKDKALNEGLRQILKLAPSVALEYENEEAVRNQVAILKNKVAEELRDLDRLYLPGHGQFLQLIGSASPTIKGDEAVELEHLNKVEDIVEKYRLAVRLTPLSVGLIRCQVRIRKKKGKLELEIPFVDQPLVASFTT
jgi:hypothetical protein